MDIVQEFPFDELCDIVADDITNIRCCLTVLIDISTINSFYEGPSRVSTTINFTLSHLSVFQNSYSKDVFTMFLTLLKNITTKLHSIEKTPFILKNTDKIFEAFIHIIKLDHFCKHIGKLFINILTEIVKLKNTVIETIEKYLILILEKLTQLSLILECDILFDVLIQRCYLETNIFAICCTWMLNSLEIIKNTDIINLANDTQQTCSFLRTTYTFYRKLCKVVHISKFNEIKIDSIFGSFVNNLVLLTPKVIRLCGYVDVEKDAKAILGITIFEFLNGNQRMTYVIETTIQQEVQNLALDVSGWWRKFSHCFFWMCHILYINKCYIWRSVHIFQALTCLIYTRKHRKTLTTILLKSICYIYPIAYMQSPSIKRKMIGDDILNVVLSDFLLFIDRVLSVTSSQLLWFLSRGTTRVKKAAVVFWLTNTNKEQCALLKHCLETTNSEYILIEILLDNQNKEIVKKCLELVELIKSPSLSQNLHNLLPKFVDHSETFPFIVRAISCHIPQDHNIALLILTTSVVTLITNDDQETLTRLCQLSSKLLNIFTKNKEKVQFFCNDVTLLRVLIYRVGVVDDDLVEELLMLIRKMLRFQREVNRNPSNVTAMKISLLLKKPRNISYKALDLLWDILRLNTLITLEKKDIFLIQHGLFNLSEQKRLSNKCHLCLMKLIKFYPALLYSPTLSTFIEDLCFYSSKNKYSVGSLKLILAWTHLVAINGKTIICFLPKENILRRFFTNHTQFNDHLVQRNLYLISEIYSHKSSAI